MTRDELLDALVAEQHNGGGFKTPPPEWNAHASTAMTEPKRDRRRKADSDTDLTRARRRREALAEWEATHDVEETA